MIVLILATVGVVLPGRLITGSISPVFHSSRPVADECYRCWGLIFDFTEGQEALAIGQDIEGVGTALEQGIGRHYMQSRFPSCKDAAITVLSGVR